eukprot:363342-Karenia_brevis.AAC.1
MTVPCEAPVGPLIDRETIDGSPAKSAEHDFVELAMGIPAQEAPMTHKKKSIAGIMISERLLMHRHKEKA